MQGFSQTAMDPANGCSVKRWRAKAEAMARPAGMQQQATWIEDSESVSEGQRTAGGRCHGLERKRNKRSGNGGHPAAHEKG